MAGEARASFNLIFFFSYLDIISIKHLSSSDLRAPIDLDSSESQKSVSHLVE